MNEDFVVLIFYKYCRVEDPHGLRHWLLWLSEKYQLTGRSIVGYEGINCTMEGTKENTEAFCNEFLADSRFSDVHIKKSQGTGQAFVKSSIKIRNEIVTLNLGNSDVNPQQLTGKHLEPETLFEWLETGQKFTIVDMRNDYEHSVGYFANSVLLPMRTFKQLPEVLPNLNHLKNSKIVTVCTFGVRCEKASAYLIQQGFTDVYQLKGGIGVFMQKYPNTYFYGKLYTFDGRIALSFGDSDKNRVIVGRCHLCNNPAEDYVNCNNDECHLHFICCPECRGGINQEVYCGEECRHIIYQKTSS